MKKQVCITTIIFSVLIIVLIFVAAQTPIDFSLKAADYVKELGWEIDENPIDIAIINLPSKFDAVYRQYNEIQKEAGFDLTEYLGKKVVRYTFAINNFDGAEGVRVNVLMHKGSIIGGIL